MVRVRCIWNSWLPKVSRHSSSHLSRQRARLSWRRYSWEVLVVDYSMGHWGRRNSSCKTKLQSSTQTYQIRKQEGRSFSIGRLPTKASVLSKSSTAQAQLSVKAVLLTPSVRKSQMATKLAARAILERDKNVCAKSPAY